MTTHRHPGESFVPSDLQAEHRALKEQTAELRREHDRLQYEGGTKEKHRQHIRKLERKSRNWNGMSSA
jgi:prefoldin subunit 5